MPGENLQNITVAVNILVSFIIVCLNQTMAGGNLENAVLKTVLRPNPNSIFIPLPLETGCQGVGVKIFP